jgi:hypothetical protein
VYSATHVGRDDAAHVREECESADTERPAVFRGVVALVPRMEEDRGGKGAKGDEERGKVGGRLVAHGESDEDDAADDDEDEGRGEVKPPLAELV